MASQRSRLESSASTEAVASPSDAKEVDLLDTTDWTAKDWEAARILAEQLKLLNAAKRAARGANNQDPIRSM